MRSQPLKAGGSLAIVGARSGSAAFQLETAGSVFVAPPR
jgi:hypothetical protein